MVFVDAASKVCYGQATWVADLASKGIHVYPQKKKRGTGPTLSFDLVAIFVLGR